LVTKKLDLARMRDSLELFIGKKDFSRFCSPNDENVSKIRDVYYFDLEKKDNLIVFKIGANSFLYNMVRIIIGSVLEIGLKKRDKASIAEVFSGKGVSLAKSIIPPKGLFLTKVEYS
jgi:tRNA pseudouridine38-40 synthase